MQISQLLLLLLALRGTTALRSVTVPQQVADGDDTDLAVPGRGAALCETPCSDSNVQEACADYRRCAQLAADETIMEKFPMFGLEWCDSTIESVYEMHCNGDADTPGYLFAEKLAAVVKIIAGEQTEGLDMGECGDVSTCGECTLADHRQGVLNYFVTSTACIWDKETSTCEPFSGESHEGLASSPSQCQGDLDDQDEDEVLDGLSGDGVDATVNEAGSFMQSRQNGTSGKNKALLVGFRYTGSRNELPGTVPDIVRVFKHLTRVRGFQPEDITVLTDDVKQFGGFSYPPKLITASVKAGAGAGTVQQLLRVFQEVSMSVNEDDFLVYHYSGHGAFTRDLKGDELDGLDETIVTPAGEHFLDDDFYEFLVSLPRATVSAISDACHNEGFSDLPFNYMLTSRRHCTDYKGSKALPVAKVMFLSGSQNHQTSADLGSGGALTITLLGNDGQHGGYVSGDSTGSVYEVMRNIMSKFKRDRISQRPSICSWPTFRDSGAYSPYDPANAAGTLMQFDEAIGGRRSDSGYDSTLHVPNICVHGYTDPQKVSHRRKPPAKTQSWMTIDVRLDDASAPTQPAPVGWVSAAGGAAWDLGGAPLPSPSEDPLPSEAPLPFPSSSWSAVKLKLKLQPKKKSTSGFFANKDGTVTKITPRGVADKAGLRVDDQILAVRAFDEYQGESTQTWTDWRLSPTKKRTIMRNGRAYELKIERYTR